MEYLAERNAIAILDEIESIEVADQYSKFDMKVLYEQREGFHVVGRSGRLILEYMQKLINIANKHGADMELDAVNSQISIHFFGLPKKTVGQS
jgi:hypothetical protein